MYSLPEKDLSLIHQEGSTRLLLISLRAPTYMVNISPKEVR